MGHYREDVYHARKVASYLFMLTRTKPDAPNHKGLTMLLVPMSTPGIAISEVKTLGGKRTNVTCYYDVRDPTHAGWVVWTQDGPR